MILLVGGCQALVWFGGYWQGFSSGHSGGWDGAMKYRDKLEAEEKLERARQQLGPNAASNISLPGLGHSADACE